MSNFKNIWYSAELFFASVFIGTLITISSANWMLAWMGMELNMMSFLGWMCSTNKAFLWGVFSWGSQDSISQFASNVEPFAKYFLAQSVGTAFFLFCPLIWGIPYLSDYSVFFLLFGMMLKSGVAPLHQWFPSVCSNVSWSVNMVLMFWQKVAPLYVIAGICSICGRMVLLIAVLNLFFGGFGALGQTQLRPLFAYSSISHMGWMMAMMFFSKVGFFYYFLLYGLMIIPTVNMLRLLKIYSFKDISGVPSGVFGYFFLLVIMLLGISGMPPFTGFFMKAYGVYLMLCMDYYGLASLFCGFAVISLSYYMNIVFISLLFWGFSEAVKVFKGVSATSHYSLLSGSVNLVLSGFIVAVATVSLPFVGVLVI